MGNKYIGTKSLDMIEQTVRLKQKCTGHNERYDEDGAKKSKTATHTWKKDRVKDPK